MEWAALVLLLIPTMPGSSNLDITDPRSFGRTLARRICQGIGRPQPSAGNGTAGRKAKEPGIDRTARPGAGRSARSDQVARRTSAQGR